MLPVQKKKKHFLPVLIAHEDARVANFENYGWNEMALCFRRIGVRWNIVNLDRKLGGWGVRSGRSESPKHHLTAKMVLEIRCRRIRSMENSYHCKI
ncbi:hypothetical protein H5410_012461 [Solanum commersonii]|uniref:Uncharacterized protein n=1 Tax=Solanum commersonii TaxID=4109 RepID=A0A9J6ASH2_SOLCO|nr:hypothetical protein H5410_012461 [Solanum commersonii]